MNQLFQKFVLENQASELIQKNIQILESDNQTYIKEKQMIQLKMKGLPKQISNMVSQIRNTLKGNQSNFQQQFFLSKKRQMQNQLENIQCYSQVAKTLKLIIQKYIQINTIQSTQNKAEQKVYQLSTFTNKLKNIYESFQIEQSNIDDFNIQRSSQKQAQKKMLKTKNSISSKMRQKLKQNISKIANKCDEILDEKCKKFVNTKNNSLLIIIQKNKIVSCSKILKNKDQIQKSYFNKILNGCIYYQIQYQQIILFLIESIQQSQSEIRVKRQKLNFKKQEAQKFSTQIYNSLQKHITLAYQLASILNIQLQHQQKTSNFYINAEKTELRSTLQYIFPYLTYQNRMNMIKLLSHGSQNQKLEDFLILLKLKNQSAQLFMENIDNIFKQIISKQEDHVNFKKEKFDILLIFLQLSLFQSEQSILTSSSKTLTKIAKNQILGKQKTNNDNLKRMLNIILLTTSHLIQKIQDLQTQNNEGNQWINSLLWMRQNVRRKIHLIQQ